jgi:hypothetical protein
MKFIMKVSLYLLFATFITIGLGGNEAYACSKFVVYEPPQPVLSEVMLVNGTASKEGYLSASITVPDGYDESIELVFVGKDGKETSRVKVDSVTNSKIMKQTVDGRDGKKYTVPLKTGNIKISARDLPLPLPDFIALKDNFSVQLTASNFVPKQTKPAMTTVISCSNDETLTSNAQPIMLANPVFPGEVSISKDGTITITIKMQNAYKNSDIFLVVLNGSGQEIKRIMIDPKRPRISATDWGLEVGEYSIFIELRSQNDKIQSSPVQWIVSKQPTGQESIPVVDLVFPGGVEVTENGAIHIVIQKQSYSSTTKFYLVITDTSGKEVKRSRVYPSNPRVTLSSKSLGPGVYTLQMEMIDGTSKVRSNPVTWEISQPSLSIPSGNEFPGAVIVNSDGTFTITITTNSIIKEYTYYIVVFDIDGSEVKRIKFDPTKPYTKTLNELKLQTGGYYFVIEIVDSKTGGKATSNPKFTTYNGSQDIIVLVDDQLQQYDQSPVNVDGRTMVPLRAIFESLGAKVEWDSSTQTVTATKDDIKVVLTINSNEAWVNGNKVMLDVPAKLINEKTMVPIRFVSEALGADVKWDDYSKSVIITNNE